jgi:hypothetical protein
MVWNSWNIRTGIRFNFGRTTGSRRLTVSRWWRTILNKLTVKVSDWRSNRCISRGRLSRLRRMSKGSRLNRVMRMNKFNNRWGRIKIRSVRFMNICWRVRLRVKGIMKGRKRRCIRMIRIS